MIPSTEGLIVAALILLVGRLLGAPLIIGLMASLPFGSTAFAAVPALGGSTPLIYTLFCILLVFSVIVRKHIIREISTVFSQFTAAWVVLVLVIYAIVSAFVFPRLFNGLTTAFIVVEGAYVELPLMPVSQNITQAAYFTLGVLTFYALSILALKRQNLDYIRQGFFAFVIANIALALIDVIGKLSGAGDVLLPIRTASYALLTEVIEAGFFRISGGYPEASTFAEASLGCLGFCYAYWRVTKSTFALLLALIMVTLLLFSTSSTAYATLAILCLFPLFSFAGALASGRFGNEDLFLLLFASLLFIVLLSLYLYSDAIFEPFVDLIDRMVFDKATSASGVERAYWNERSIQSFIDTHGIGIGMGSSRSSSWIISVLSQLGLVGFVAMVSLLYVIFRGMNSLKPTADTIDLFALASGLRAAVVAMLIGACLAGSGADPGIVFFLALSGILACRRHVKTRSANILQMG